MMVKHSSSFFTLKLNFPPLGYSCQNIDQDLLVCRNRLMVTRKRLKHLTIAAKKNEFDFSIYPVVLSKNIRNNQQLNCKQF